MAVAIASWHRASSPQIPARDLKIKFACVSVWFPSKWPRAEISPTNSGQARANFPIRKNVARTEWRSNRSRSLGVTAGLGPSSKVSAIFRAEDVCRNVGPNNSDQGATAPHAAIPAAVAAPAVTTMGQEFNSPPQPIFARPCPECQALFGQAVGHFPIIAVDIAWRFGRLAGWWVSNWRDCVRQGEGVTRARRLLRQKLSQSPEEERAFSAANREEFGQGLNSTFRTNEFPFR